MRPFTLERAADAHGARQMVLQGSPDQAPQYLAGGTNLLDLMKCDVVRPDALVDIGRLRAGLGSIDVDADGLRLGALVRMAEAAEHPAIRRDYPVLSDALAKAASAQLRNMASPAGTVLQRTRCNYFRDPSWSQCNKRVPGSGCAAIPGMIRRLAVLGVSGHCIANYPGDFAVALVALGAEVELLGEGGATRTIPVEDLHRLPGDTPHVETTMAPGELVSAFRVPTGPWTRRSLYLKVRDRATFAFALASAAVALDLAADGTVMAARIGLGGLAAELGLDPIELRRRNEPERDPVSGLPFSSRSLLACFEQGAAQFGWAARDPAPGSMRHGDWQVGYGCATAAYGANISSAAARLTLRPSGHLQVRLAGHDIGTGAYTVVAITAADRLGLRLDQVMVEIGDTELPPTGLAAGSSHTATIAHAVARGCDELRARIAHAACTSNEGPLTGQDPAALVFAEGHVRAPGGASEAMEDAVRRVSEGAIEVYAENVPAGSPEGAMGKLYGGQNPMLRGHKRKDATTYAFGAQFAEVHVHRLTREIRVPRMLGAFAAGRIVNPLTAHSQYMGGMIWGLSGALLEATEIDPHAARYVNDNLSEYHIAVNADVSRVEVLFVPETDDQVNPLGIKGIGELGIVGMNAAIANAVHHATGRRIRTLPIRLEDLL